MFSSISHMSCSYHLAIHFLLLGDRSLFRWPIVPTAHCFARMLWGAPMGQRNSGAAPSLVVRYKLSRAETAVFVREAGCALFTVRVYQLVGGKRGESTAATISSSKYQYHFKIFSMELFSKVILLLTTLIQLLLTRGPCVVKSAAGNPEQ